MKRRDFIRRTALMAGAATLGNNAFAAAKEEGRTSSGMMAGQQPSEQEQPDKLQPQEETPLIASAPMLQNYAETSMGVAFAVRDLANGYVIYGQRPDLSDGKKVKCGGYRTTEISDRVIQVRLTDLQPNTTYYYKIGADRIHYGGGYDMKVLGNEEDPRIYRFTTAGAATKTHFCVINDTHARWEPFGRAIDKIAALAPQCVIWNGDASNVEETIEAQMRIFLNPEIERKDYAAEIPYLFCPGNHDSRGLANRHLEKVWMYRQPEERASRDWDLGRNFAVRMGEVALIGLDTAEDKLDTNPIFAGLFNSGAYREAQVAWLNDALQRPEIASAPYLVAFCHIPLFASDPSYNPGDVAPADKDPQYSTDFALWQRTCAKLWTPLLAEAGCQLIITAHQHRYSYDAPTAERSWAQIVGGGPEMGFSGSGENRRERPELFPTLIEGEVKGGKLVVTVHNLLSGKVQETLEFKRR